jgi:MFS family permease
LKRSPLLPIFLIVLTDIFGFTLVIPLLAIYAERMSATPLQATLLVSVYAVFQLISGPILGGLSDRFGRKPLLLVSQLGTLAGFILLARAEALWVMFVARILDGATAGNISIAQAYISDNTLPENRAKSFAVIGIAFGVGFFLGPFVTGQLATYSLNAPVWAAAGLSLTSILCTTFLLPGGAPKASTNVDPGPGGKRLSVFRAGAYSPYFSRPILGGLLVQFLLFALSFSTFTSGFALFAERRFTWDGHPFTPREIGFLFAWAGFLGILVQGFLGRLVKKLGESPLVAFGFAAMGLGYIGLAWAQTPAQLVAVASVASIGNAVLRPSLSSLVSQQAGPHEQGIVLGVNQSLSSVAQILAPILGGYLIEQGLLSSWALVAGAVSLVGLAASRWGSALVKRRVTALPASRRYPAHAARRKRDALTPGPSPPGGEGNLAHERPLVPASPPQRQPTQTPALGKAPEDRRPAPRHRNPKANSRGINCSGGGAQAAAAHAHPVHERLLRT